MALNRKPLTEVTDEQIEAYARDGAVVVPNVFDKEWMVETLRPVMNRLVIEREDMGLLPHIPNRYMSRTIPEVRSLIFDSALAEVAGKVLQSKEIRFFFEEMFAKPPKSDDKTIWHVDRMGWPVSRESTMIPSLWMPIYPVTKANSMECVAGSHTQDVPYWLFSPNVLQMKKLYGLERPDDRPGHPNCEPLRDDPNATILSWNMDPGDLLIIHPWVLHYSGGNPNNEWRMAISARVFGDDVRWDPRVDCLNLAGVSFDEMIPGQRPSGTMFPLLWSEDGRRDTDEAFPRGFATSWSSESDEQNDFNAYDDFKQLSKTAYPGHWKA
jgi:ectoine hydroxylase-related dioxygenase (phytanoyl-CoA dioxygenase family)